MEKVAEEFQFLGAFGIVREAFNILFHSSCTKLLGGITLDLLFPLSFSTLGHTFIFEPLFRKIACHEVILYSQMGVNSPARERTLRELTLGSTELIVFIAVVLVFIYDFWILSTAAMVYTVASIYTAKPKNLSFARVMRIVSRVWDRLMITYLWDIMILMAIHNAAGLALFLLAFFSVGAGYRLNSGVFVFSSLLIILIFICADVYISVVWKFTSVISVVEDEYYVLEAMRKSHNIIKGKRIMTLALVLFYMIFRLGIGGLFWYAVVDGHGNGVGTSARAVYGTILIGLLCFVNLMGLLTQSVFYFVCKSYLHESIDDQSFLEVCNMDVESYATVSATRGKKSDNASPVECVRDAFPGGSMTGAPKLRAMESIHSIENTSKGVFWDNRFFPI